MITKGEKLIVWDSTVEDMYTATAVQDTDDELLLNPLVEICGVVKYPMQRSALFPDRASENSPLAKGTVCRLRLICKGWLCFDCDYETSLVKARNLMIDDVLTRLNRGGNTLNNATMTAARTEFELLMQHKRGEYAPRTLMGRDTAFVMRRH